MADDAGALLVRSGLVSSSALDEARSKIADLGGTLGEQLVASGIVADDALTDFYKQRLLVPQVNPNTLARLPAKVVAVIPSDMAIELRAIPVSLDNDNNLTVAMSDPSDRHAVDEISFFTGTYVVRAVATQMQIAWCLAHYYGHVTNLGKRLLQPDADVPAERVQAAVRPRPRGMTGEVDAMRHRGIVPGQAMAAKQPEPVGKDTDEVPAVPDTSDEAEPDAKNPRARSISGEIRVQHRAASIKPPLPEDDSGPIVVMEMEAGEPSGPQITMEAGEPDDGDDTDPAKRPAPKRRRPAEPDPPELAARAGEVEMKSVDRDIGEGPSIVVDDILDTSKQVSGEIAVRDRRDGPAHPHISVEVSSEENAPVMIRERSQPAAVESVVTDEASAPILLDRKRGSNPPPQVADAKKRGDRRTAIGLGAVGGRSHRDTIEAAPAQLDDDPTGQNKIVDLDPTRVDAQAAPPRDDTSSDEILAAPPSPIHGDDTSPIAAPPRAATPQPSGQIRLENVKRKASVHDDDDDDDADDEPKAPDVHGGKPTMVMTAVELDDIIPGRVEVGVPAHLDKTKPNIDYDPVDDGWGPPGTTIPPPLLGAIPGVGDTRASGSIPIPNLDSQPLMVAPPAPPEHARPHTITQAGILRALEQATERMLDLIRDLERATDRDAVVSMMIGYLAETHRRAGFFAVRGGELSLFSITPNLVVMPAATVRLDRPSTLQDVVGTRLPYRGPMHDETSRMFLQSVLGVCPPEILLVPITVRERVVGVLFGEHRLRHTFDDQLALASRAAGNALERILKSKRG